LVSDIPAGDGKITNHFFYSVFLPASACSVQENSVRGRKKVFRCMDHLVLRHTSYMRGFTFPFSLSVGAQSSSQVQQLLFRTSLPTGSDVEDTTAVKRENSFHLSLFVKIQFSTQISLKAKLIVFASYHFLFCV
jgi:hypothetical protein